MHQVLPTHQGTQFHHALHHSHGATPKRRVVPARPHGLVVIAAVHALAGLVQVAAGVERLGALVLADAPLVRVSALTGEGLPELKRVLHERAQSVEPRSTAGVFRLPIQRVGVKDDDGPVRSQENVREVNIPIGRP